MVKKFYYFVSSTPQRFGKGEGTLVWATDTNDAKKAWRYIHNKEGKALYVQKINSPNNEQMANKAIRHANVMLGHWNRP